MRGVALGEPVHCCRFELGFLTKLLRWCNNASTFYYAHGMLNVFPMQLLDAIRIALEWIFSIFGRKVSKQFSTTVRILASCSTLPMQYHPFSSPSTPWRFKSCVRLPEEWDLFEYLLICCRAGYEFAVNPLQGPQRGYAKQFSEIRICSQERLGFASDVFGVFKHLKNICLQF